MCDNESRRLLALALIISTTIFGFSSCWTEEKNLDVWDELSSKILGNEKIRQVTVKRGEQPKSEGGAEVRAIRMKPKKVEISFSEMRNDKSRVNISIDLEDFRTVYTDDSGTGESAISDDAAKIIRDLTISAVSPYWEQDSLGVEIVGGNIHALGGCLKVTYLLDNREQFYYLRTRGIADMNRELCILYSILGITHHVRDHRGVWRVVPRP